MVTPEKEPEQGHISSDQLIEGIHYYIENGLWVFLEAYHLNRGYCCQSGCRHCPYGFRKGV